MSLILLMGAGFTGASGDGGGSFRITSNGGGETAEIGVDDGSTVVPTVTMSGGTPPYSVGLFDGDAAAFSVSGSAPFVITKDAPFSFSDDPELSFTIRATDDDGTIIEQDLTINVNEPPSGDLLAYDNGDILAFANGDFLSYT